MTNDNNNINELVSFPDDDPTAELEIPQALVDEILAGDAADDVSRPDSDVAAREGAAEEEIEVLKSDLISSTEHIERLQAEIAELRSTAGELEQEIELQGTVTRQLNDEVGALTGELQAARTELADRQADFTASENQLDAARREAKQGAEDTEQFRRAAKNDRTQIRKLERRLTSGGKKLASLEKKHAAAREKQRADRDKIAASASRIRELETQFSESEAAFEELHRDAETDRKAWSYTERQLSEVQTELDRVRAEAGSLAGRCDEIGEDLQRSQSRTDDLASQLAARVEECNRLRSDNREIQRVLQNDSDNEAERNRRLIAKQSGLLAGYSQEIRQLSARVAAAERYADELRHGLRTKSDICDAAVDAKSVLQSAQAVAQERIADLSKIQETSQRTIAELTDAIAENENRSGGEIRRLRRDLEAAQESATEQNAINEQLLSDLYDNKGFRQALETRITEMEERHDRKVRHLEQKANRLRNQADDYERRLKNKDNAIAALMNELANRSSKIEAIGEIENVIQEIDERKSSRLERQGPHDRERIAKLLVGRNEGKELRFPLFKSRLTIGRTAHNDIQLKAQFISRRHAVVVTEKGGTRIVDWGSRNGVFVNEKRVAEKILKNGDIVTIGTTDFRYEERPKR